MDEMLWRVTVLDCIQNLNLVEDDLTDMSDACSHVSFASSYLSSNDEGQSRPPENNFVSSDDDEELVKDSEEFVKDNGGEEETPATPKPRKKVPLSQYDEKELIALLRDTPALYNKILFYNNSKKPVCVDDVMTLFHDSGVSCKKVEVEDFLTSKGVLSIKEGNKNRTRIRKRKAKK
ncbi:hypothetical protein HDU97_004647 [Phlyctochytrium planicorne]|nr:hypothetical protein HDU97_004647 [Phlyctochytrium planicorne]